MSSDRTEKATPRRREEARKEGRVARRPDLAASAAFLAAVLVLRAMASPLADHAIRFMRGALTRSIGLEPLTASTAHGLFVDAFAVVGLLATPVVAVALVTGIGANFAQGGLTLTPKAFELKPERFSPVSNLKRVFGPQTPVELLKAMLKLAALVLVCYGPVSEAVMSAPEMLGLPAGEALTTAGSLAGTLGLRAAVVFVLFAGLDYGYGWYQYEKSLRMTKDEVKREFKDQEGDPMVKGQRRRAARALIRQRISVEVPKADVIVTNPTHFAVAIRYDQANDAAPIVVAKGADEMARKIREIAKAHDVPIVENPPLARALYRAVEPGRAIAPEFFRAVAELLAFVYRNRQR